MDMIDTEELALMKSDAILINASRGGVVNETALVEALRTNKLAGAGLDVFSEEPVPADHPILKIENVILTPHSAALTGECVIRMATEAARCVIDVFAGRIPRNVANPEVLDSGRWKFCRSVEAAD
jgi:D-3-phosphoglycerate dehydrogenase